jgi:hypothetical protein
MSDEIEFLMHQHQQQTEFQRKQSEIRARQYVDLQRQTTTKHTTIPDMRDAMAQVRNSPSDYPEAYKDFIRRTSGRPV